MIAKSVKAMLFVCGFFCALWLSGSGCGKGTTEPVPVVEKDYVVYLPESYPGTYCYTYHTLTGDIEKFELPYNGPESGLAVSPDGKKLYMNPPGKIVELDADSMAVISEHALPFAIDSRQAQLLVSPDGSYLAAIKRSSIAIIDLGDFSVRFRDTTQAYYNFHISDDSRYIFCGAYDSIQGTDFTTIDVWDNFAKHQQLLAGIGAFNDIKSSRDNTILYFIIVLDYDNALFRIYDRQNDSVLFDKQLSPGYNDMQLTNDGKYAYLTQPGFGFWGVPGKRELRKFETIPPYKDIAIAVKAPDLSDTLIPTIIIPRNICKTPDGQRLIGVDVTSNVFFDLNIRTDSFNRFPEIYGNPLIQLPICQRNP